MSNSSNQSASQEGKGGGLGYSVEIDTHYDTRDEFEKPGYAHGPEGHFEAHSDKDGGYKVHAEGSVGGTRVVSTGLSAQADGPSGKVRNQADQDGAYIGAEGTLGEAEAHAGPVGVGVQGPGAGVGVEVKEGLKVGAEANLASGKVEVGPVKVGAGVGLKGVLQANKDAVGAIVPGVGGAVFGKDGVEVGLGPFSFKVGF